MLNLCLFIQMWSSNTRHFWLEQILLARRFLLVFSALLPVLLNSACGLAFARSFFICRYGRHFFWFLALGIEYLFKHSLAHDLSKFLFKVFGVFRLDSSAKSLLRRSGFYTNAKRGCGILGLHLSLLSSRFSPWFLIEKVLFERAFNLKPYRAPFPSSRVECRKLC